MGLYRFQIFSAAATAPALSVAVGLDITASCSQSALLKKMAGSILLFDGTVVEVAHAITGNPLKVQSMNDLPMGSRDAHLAYGGFVHQKGGGIAFGAGINPRPSIIWRPMVSMKLESTLTGWIIIW